MKRKILSLLLGLIMLLPLCLAACSGGQNEDPNDNPPIVTPGDPDDGLYPSDPNFDALSGFDSTDTSRWGEAKAHDPSVIEADGKFYVFSTDNDGGYGYQVRTSDDLIHWSFVGFAIENCGTSVSDAKSTYEAGNGGLQDQMEEGRHPLGWIAFFFLIQGVYVNVLLSQLLTVWLQLSEND